mgnify:FL=1
MIAVKKEIKFNKTFKGEKVSKTYKEWLQEFRLADKATDDHCNWKIEGNHDELDPRETGLVFSNWLIEAYGDKFLERHKKDEWYVEIKTGNRDLAEKFVKGYD